MTTVGDVLDEFFSPLSSPTLWVMPESDDYTTIVRAWRPTVEATNRTKQNLAMNSALWSTKYVTQPLWRPSMTDALKAGAHREFVRSPPGTDPETCKNAFVTYVASKVARNVPGPVPMRLIPEIQTRNLYTCSIGSFNIYTTVDEIDCGAKKATLNYWMYNAMSRISFGRFASHPAFSLSRMATQYMWWNWVESVDWSSGAVRVIPRKAGGGRW